MFTVNTKKGHYVMSQNKSVKLSPAICKLIVDGDKELMGKIAESAKAVNEVAASKGKVADKATQAKELLEAGFTKKEIIALLGE